MAQLHKAIKEGNADAVRTLIENGEDVNALFGMQGTPLCSAIQADKLDIVEALIEAKCDVNASDYDGEPPLCLAIRKGRDDIVSRLLAGCECDVNRVDPVSGHAPLTLAVMKGRNQVVDWLLKAGCNINKQGEDQMALHLAVIFKNLCALQLILADRRCDVHMWNKNGETALHLCAKQADTEALSVMLSDCVVRQESSENIDKHTLNLNQSSMIDNFTALHIAVNHKNFDAASLLIDAGCTLDIPNTVGETALHIACRCNQLAMVDLLLRAGACPNAKVIRTKSFHVVASRTACSPIHIAIEHGNLEIVRRLVDAGADINCKSAGGGSREGHSPLTQALWTNQPDMVWYFLGLAKEKGMVLDVCSNSRKNNPLFAVSSCDSSREIAQELINLGCSVNGECEGERPLECAVEVNNTEVAEVLLDNGASVDCGTNLLPLCIDDDRSVHMLHLLLFHGADMYAQTKSTWSIMQDCIEDSQFLGFILLVDCGYNLSQEKYLRREFAKNTPELVPCLLRMEPDIMQWLRERAFTPQSLQVQARTALRKHFVSKRIPIKGLEELYLPKELKHFVMLKGLVRGDGHTAILPFSLSEQDYDIEF